uniref:Amino acid transporter family protein n=1 Tax=Trepomonas sp. PC1 TaxID=1076344 RepID=A0A146KEI2_9EUKA|eukprot:JAP94075.1 Amino acid transporter family protein [Trepomonas sp. PC1]
MIDKSVNTNILWITISFTFLSSCFGAGLLSIPGIAVKMGILPFIIMNLFAVSFSLFCFYQIIQSQAQLNCKPRTMTYLISLHYGKIWLFFFDLSIIFCLLPISYIAVSADYFRNFLKTVAHLTVMDDPGWRMGMKFITCLCIMYPLTLIKTIKALSYIASLSIVFVFTSVGYVIVKFGIWKSTGEIIKGIHHDAPKVPIGPLNASMIPDVLTYICMFFSLYSMHASVVCVMYEYRNDFQVKNDVIKKQITKAIFYLTLPIAFTVYTGYGIIGVFMFDQEDCKTSTIPGCLNANSNVLLSFGEDIAAVVIELLFSIVVFVSFPCMLYPIRKSVIMFMKLDIDMNTKKGYLKYNAVGLGITLVCLFVAVFLDDVGQIQSFTANLLGIILYAMSGVMLWYKSGQKPENVIVGLNDDENDEEQLESNVESTKLTGETQEKAELIQHPKQITKQRTIMFWIYISLLVLLNIGAIGCQIYTWFR